MCMRSSPLAIVLFRLQLCLCPGASSAAEEYLVSAPAPACKTACLQDPKGCAGDLCCSLNGKIQGDGTCLCDRPWSGSRCEKMDFLPISFPQGYGMSPNLTTWGATPVFDGSKYHIFVAAMTNKCGLDTWMSNSRIDHATSSSITGPYVLEDVAVNTWSHNPALVKLADGSYALFHIGDGSGGPEGGQNCTQSLAGDTEASAGFASTGGSSIHVAKSLSGPWNPLQDNTLGPCNNPSPWMHRNGTIYVVCSGGATGNGLHRAERIQGPWTLVVSDLDVSGAPFPGGPWGVYEDPYLYMDQRDHFHLLYHVYETGEPGSICSNSTVSAHLFSIDGHSWHASPSQPFTSVLSMKDGGSVVVSTRERPKLFFDSTGQMTHLFNGVSGSESCWPRSGGGPDFACVNCKFKAWDYTLVMPLDIHKSEAVLQV